MKKLIYSFIISVYLFTAGSSFAQTPSPTATKPTITDEAENSSLTEQINTLKDRIASRVAELNLVEKRGIIGTVTNATDTQIIVKDISGKTRIVDVDEITKFSSLSKKANYGISDITRNTKISILGTYNKETKRLLARYVNEVVLPTYIVGYVKSINEDDFSIVITTNDKKDITVDVENVTKTSSYTKETELTKSGFSKIAVGNRIVVAGYPSKTDSSKIISSRIILFPELPNNPQADASTSQPTPQESTR